MRGRESTGEEEESFVRCAGVADEEVGEYSASGVV